MSNNFWKKLQKNKKPFFALAPMVDVSDAALRQIVTKYGKPDILFTEFVACDGLCSIGKEKLMPLLQFSENERPIVAQLFGSKPENFEESAKLMAELGFDGIDINMGCPQKNIIKQGAGAKLIDNPELAKEIIRATKRGAGDLLVSIKTRIGYKKNEIEKWLPILLEEKPAAITLHGRTQKEMSKVPANWDIIKKGVEIAKGSGVLILGNGDIKNIEEGIKRAEESGVDGVMIGRAIFGNPWLFNNDLAVGVLSIKEKLGVLIEHIELYEKFYGGEERIKPFNLMKKHIGAYVRGFKGAKELRIELMKTENEKETTEILKKYLN
ncbi:MAG: tRNA-dihydrouridine synthase [Candidatus Pacebacteria bacterium]|nr:tRNA-dihydrouridine synthase [Candidatus Paceibacterota bacterium]